MYANLLFLIPYYDQYQRGYRKDFSLGDHISVIFYHENSLANAIILLTFTAK
jgi:hypothetical protein